MRIFDGLSSRAVDLVVMLAILTVCVVESLVSTETDRTAALVVSIAVVVPLAYRRRWPMAVLSISYGIAIVSLFVVDDLNEFTAPFLVLLIGAYTAGWLPRNRDAVIGLVMSWAAVVAVAVNADPIIFGDFVFPGGFVLFAWAVGRAIRHRTLLAAELHEATLRAEEERERDAARAIAEERRRIAREMHDLVGHSVSVMVVQAGGARRILDRDPSRAVAAAAQIEQTGRAALAEMRRLLGLMGPQEGDHFAPQPTLAGLGALVERACEAGLPARLAIDGEPRELPAGAELAAYRVVQEALTNAIRHAASAPTDVLVRWDPDALEVVVSDSGPTRPDTDGFSESGHGLVGMHERVKVYGGTLTARPRPDGGFTVRARIPLEQGEVRAA